MAESGALGNHTGAAYVKMGLIKALYVHIRTSFWCPQLVPTRALRMPRRDLEDSAMFFMCGLKVKCVSKVTPRMRGCRHSGSVAGPMLTEGLCEIGGCLM